MHDALVYTHNACNTATYHIQQSNPFPSKMGLIYVSKNQMRDLYIVVSVKNMVFGPSTTPRPFEIRTQDFQNLLISWICPSNKKISKLVLREHHILGTRKTQKVAKLTYYMLIGLGK